MDNEEFKKSLQPENAATPPNKVTGDHTADYADILASFMDNIIKQYTERIKRAEDMIDFFESHPDSSGSKAFLNYFMKERDSLRSALKQLTQKRASLENFLNEDFIKRVNELADQIPSL